MKQLFFTFFAVLVVSILNAQDITLLNQYSGHIDFTMIGNTLNPSDNSIVNPCIIAHTSSATLTLDPNDQVEVAFLYWSGSGTGDLNVDLNNQSITPDRTFSDSVNGLPFFSAFKDVTAQLQNTGNGQYTLSNFNLAPIINSYCQTETNYGGWSIFIIYSNDNLPINQISFYDGLESVSQSSTTLAIQLNSLNVLDNTNAKVGFLAWEGDRNLAVNETLRINGNLISNPPLNPPNNVFNGTNSFNNSNTLYNMDMDFYNIENYIDIGDTSALVELTSGQDFVMINAVAVKLSNQLPDAIVAINNFDLLDCLTREITVDFTVTNIEENGELPVNMPVSIYADNTYITTVFTQNILLPNQSEDFTETINIPSNVPDDFVLRIVADDNNGTGIIFESNELNNEDETEISLFAIPEANNVPDFLACDDAPNTNDGIVTFDTSAIENIIVNGQTDITITYTDALGNILASPFPNTFTTTSQTITVLVENTNNTTCFAETTINFIVVANPIANPVSIDRQCSVDQNGIAIFDTSQIEQEVLQGQTDVAVTYFNEDGTQILPTLPANFETQTQTITIVVTSTILADCTATTTLEFNVDLTPTLVNLDPYILCDDQPDPTDGIAIFDTSTIENDIINGQTNITITYTDALGNVLPSPFPSTFTSTTQTINILIENSNNNACFVETTVDFVVVENPIANPVTIARQCDDDHDGFVIFDTSQIEQEVLQGQTDVEVTYFNEDGTQILPTLPDLFNTNTQTITIIVTSTILNECSSETTLEFIVDTLPFSDPISLLLCDDLPDLNDGIATFDTSEIENTLLNGQTNVTIIYTDQMGNNIPSPFPNTFTTATQTINVSLENNLNTECTAETTITFTVVPNPVANLVTIARECGDQDGFATFDTSQIAQQVILDQTEVELTYFNEDGTQILPTLPSNFNTQSQTITIVITSSLLADCTDSTTLEFIVDVTPTAAPIDPFIFCDEDPDNSGGVFTFDTSAIQNSIVNGQTNITITYTDALGNLLPNPFPSTFTTTTQDINVLIVNNINTDCTAETIIQFIVEPLPEFNVIDTFICENSFPETVTVFVDNPQGDYNYEWFNNINELIGTGDNFEITQSGNYSVTATSVISEECSTTKFFEVVGKPLVFNQPQDFLICDEGNNQAVFNLDQAHTQITEDLNLEVSFYTNLEDLENNENEISTQYTNISNPQTIYARIEDRFTGCYNYVSFTIQVYDCLPFIPDAFTPNNDDTNEIFIISGLHDVFPDFELYIYNRYGNLIFTGTNNTPDWDGTYKGNELPVGTYFYHLGLNDEAHLYSDIKGWIYLNR